MTPANIKLFIEGLKKARQAVIDGNTGCGNRTGSRKCWTCAMRYKSGLTMGWHMDTTGFRVDFPANWSLSRPKSATLALFDNSIKALQDEYDQLEREAMGRDNGTYVAP